MTGDVTYWTRTMWFIWMTIGAVWAGWSGLGGRPDPPPLVLVVALAFGAVEEMEKRWDFYGREDS